MVVSVLAVLFGLGSALSAGSAVVHAQNVTVRAAADLPPDATQQGRTAQEAFETLANRFVRPVDSTAVLTAGWERLARDAAASQAPAPGPPPAFTGDAAGDIAAVRAALSAYLASAPQLPDNFVPVHALVRGMAAALDEGHTYFLNPRQYQDFQAWTRGDVHYSGIGARMHGPDPFLTVVEVFPGSPAERAGLRPGDVVRAVDGASIEGMPLDQTISLVQGPEGSTVSLDILREGEPDSFTLTVERGEIAVDFVTSHPLDSGVGYVRLRGFAEGVSEQFEQAVSTLTDEGARALVVDLRGNSGGRIDVGTRVLGHFVKPGSTLYQQVDRTGRTQARSSRFGRPYGLPTVVLVDSGTASMGEIFAAALQEQGLATVIGSTTAGSVAAAQVFPLADGSAVQVTVMEIRSGTGRQINGVGVTPDEAVSSPATADPRHDQALTRAQEVLAAALQTPVATSLPVGPALAAGS